MDLMPLCFIKDDASDRSDSYDSDKDSETFLDASDVVPISATQVLSLSRSIPAYLRYTGTESIPLYPSLSPLLRH